MKTTTLNVHGLFEELDHLGVEKQLRRADGVASAEANPASDSVTVKYDEKVTEPGELVRLLNACGYHCRARPLPAHLCDADQEHGETAERRAAAAEAHPYRPEQEARPPAGTASAATWLGRSAGSVGSMVWGGSWLFERKR